MKKIVTLLVFCSIVFSCENSAESVNLIQGKWNVTQITGGLSQAVNYEQGSFTWNFNLNNNTITIVNTSQPFDTQHTPTFTNNRGGTYTFEIITENDIDYLIVGDRKGAIIFTEDGLMIDYGIAFDDIAYILKR